ncbi:unnamed protein product [Merluccius merluccius]
MDVFMKGLSKAKEGMAVAAEKTKEGVAVAAEKTKEGVMFVGKRSPSHNVTSSADQLQERRTRGGGGLCNQDQQGLACVAEKTTGAMGNIAAATGLVKKDEFPTDMNYALPVCLPSLSYVFMFPQGSQDYEPEA